MSTCPSMSARSARKPTGTFANEKPLTVASVSGITANVADVESGYSSTMVAVVGTALLFVNVPLTVTKPGVVLIVRLSEYGLTAAQVTVEIDDPAEREVVEVSFS